MPNPHSTTGLRTVSNVPTQALALMNNPLVIEQSQQWGQRLMSEQTDPDARIRHAYLTCLSRPPTAAEMAAAKSFLQSQPDDLAADPHDPRLWADFCHVLLNTKEFLFVR